MMDIIDDTLERDMIDRWMRLHTTRSFRHRHVIKNEEDLEKIQEWIDGSSSKTLNNTMVHYSVDEYGRINVYGNCIFHIHTHDMRLTEFPCYIKFNIVKGDFYAESIGVKNMSGFPSKVYGDFRVSKNRLKSLKGGPFFVKGVYQASDNKLRTIKGLPNERVAEYFRIFSKYE